MNSTKSNSSHRAAGRPLLVEWLEWAEALPVALLSQRKILKQSGLYCGRPVQGFRRPSGCPSSFRARRPFSRAFTILELMIVIGIIGLMAGLALPHLSGFTKSNSMTAATRQLLDDVGLARQRALVNRAEVCLVFLPSSFWTNDVPQITNAQVINLANHQYSAYALIALRSVGDQPGRPYVHYLTDWRFLPQGVYISPFQFTNSPGLTNWVSTTNTLGNGPLGLGLSNGWPISAFPTNISFPFPSTFMAANLNGGLPMTNNLPYIAFTPSGQLTAGVDQFIMLTSGSIFCQLGLNGLPQVTIPADPPSVVETPPGNATNNPNLIHIDWLTARARLERNQF